ncbi:MAG TPA: PocR ligand-binding domain-containing protein [Anaerolineaceae bacterium]|nr:PocR ligand-binding domain-containing protein [Anaerolineaceae bacterium]
MEKLLTTRQVQDLLHVKRITVYRMLQDGRLKGVKIGQQWRFSQAEVERLLSGGCCEETPVANDSRATFPSHCVQSIQDLVADLGLVGALTIDSAQGEPLTEVSSPCEVCRLMLASEKGEQACRESWRQMEPGRKPGWVTCHAGLSYIRAAVTEQNRTVAFFLAGQVVREANANRRLVEKWVSLARQYDIDPEALLVAARELRTITDGEEIMLESWAKKTAETIESILHERAGLMDRLQKIADLSRA